MWHNSRRSGPNSQNNDRNGATLIVVAGQYLGRGKQGRRNIAQRIQLCSGRRDGADQKRRNLIIRERLASEFVDQWTRLSGEIADALRGGRDNGCSRFALPTALSFVVAEKEVPIAAERAAQGCSELV